MLWWRRYDDLLFYYRFLVHLDAACPLLVGHPWLVGQVNCRCLIVIFLRCLCLLTSLAALGFTRLFLLQVCALKHCSLTA